MIRDGLKHIKTPLIVALHQHPEFHLNVPAIPTGCYFERKQKSLHAAASERTWWWHA